MSYTPILLTEPKNSRRELNIEDHFFHDKMFD